MFYSIREIGALQRKTKSTVSKLSCYMMVSAKECMDVWSARLLLNPHSAQNHWTWTTSGCAQIWRQNLQESWSTVASIGLWNIWKFKCLKWYSWETHTIVDAITTIWIDLVVSLRAQFEIL